MPTLDILIPTCNRPSALAVTLTGLCFQRFTDFRVCVADQSDEPVFDHPTVRTLLQLLEKKGHEVAKLSNLPRRGMAQQRQFLLDSATAPYSLFIDDDVLLEPFAIKNMMEAIRQDEVGFVGQGLIGLSFRHDVRPDEQAIELWEEIVHPEVITPDSQEWQRYKLHNAANVLHVQEKLGATPDQPVKYKVAWIGGCTLYDTEKLRSVGGFGFWKDVPKEHAGEDVYAQLQVMKRYGGYGILPSGAYHQELPTTIPNRKFDIPKELAL